MAVETHDNLQAIFRKGLGIMVVALSIEMLMAIMVAWSIHGKEVVVARYQKDTEEELDLDTLVKMEKSISKWRCVTIVSALIGAVALITEISLLIALVLVPAVLHLRNLSCFIYVAMYAITGLTTYVCLGVLIDRTIYICRQGLKMHTCVDTCILKAILKIMGSCMWLVIVVGFIAGAVYCAIYATTRY